MMKIMTAQGVPNPGRVDVLIADRSRMASRLLSDLLSRKPHFNVIAALVPSEVLAAVAGHPPEIVVLSADVDEGPAKGVEIARELHARWPAVRIVMLTDTCDRESVIAVFRAGASGIFSRSGRPADFCKCIECIYKGQIWAEHYQIQFLIDALINTAPSRVLDARGNELLSGRELEVVQLAVRGCTNREIADRMKLSEHTVKNYLFRAFDKLGVSNRVEMLFYVLRQSGSRQNLAFLSKPSPVHLGMEELMEAAEAGSVAAQLVLGTKYSHGTGGEKDFASAYFWLRVAEEQATEVCQKSRSELQRLVSRMSSDEKDPVEKRVLEWMKSRDTKPVQGVDGVKRRLLSTG